METIKINQKVVSDVIGSPETVQEGPLIDAEKIMLVVALIGYALMAAVILK